MKKLFNLKRGSIDVGQSRGTDTPEFNAPRGVRQFCESDSAQAGVCEEVTHLPIIVEACESSPAAAAAAAYQIRKFLSKDNYNKPAVQYNAIMLIGILSNNPGPTFTKNIDAKFITTIKDLIKNSQDPSVQQMIRETLANLERDKSHDTNLKDLLTMWTKEKDTPLPQNTYVHRHPNNPASSGAYGRGFPYAAPRQPGLPPPHELVGRIEEAKSSASLLVQLLQSTPPAEFASNELIKEFAGRCTSAQKSIQQYMNATDPSPDEQTFKTLIETSEQLSLAQARHQRAKLAAYKYANPSPQPQALGQGDPLATAGAAQVQGQGQGQVPTILAPQPQRSQPTAPSANGALIDTSVPPTTTTRYPVGAPAGSAAGDNPFGDENRIPDPQAQYQQNNNRYSQASFEMPANTTAQHPAFKSVADDSADTKINTTDQLRYAPPGGPPPGRSAEGGSGAPVLPPVGSSQQMEDGEDMYDVSPASVRKTPLNGEAPQEQVSSFVDSQGRSYGSGMPYSVGEARTLGNVRDDEPSGAPSAATGWRTYQ